MIDYFPETKNINIKCTFYFEKIIFFRQIVFHKNVLTQHFYISNNRVRNIITGISYLELYFYSVNFELKIF